METYAKFRLQTSHFSHVGHSPTPFEMTKETNASSVSVLRGVRVTAVLPTFLHAKPYLHDIRARQYASSMHFNFGKKNEKEALNEKKYENRNPETASQQIYEICQNLELTSTPTLIREKRPLDLACVTPLHPNHQLAHRYAILIHFEESWLNQDPWRPLV